MAELSGAVLKCLIESCKHDTDVTSEERYQLTMTEDEWAIVMANAEKLHDSDDLMELRADYIESMHDYLLKGKLSIAEIKLVQKSIEEIEQAPLSAICKLSAQLARWQFEVEGLPYLPEDQVHHPSGIAKDVRLLDFGSIRISEEALKTFLIEPLPSDATSPKLTDEQLEYVNE